LAGSAALHILANYNLPLNTALGVSESSLSVEAEINFLAIERPPHNYRYFGKNCWVRIETSTFSNIACLIVFPDDKEYFDGDTVLVNLEFYPDEPHIEQLTSGVEFKLSVVGLNIASGNVL